MKVMGIIFTNDATLGKLTAKRSIAAVPYGGRYRLIDFALSNLSCAGVRHVAIVSRFNFHSLMDHIGDGEEWCLELGEGGLQYMTPYAQSLDSTYRGKLESLGSAMSFMEYDKNDEIVVMMDSANIYNMDVKALIEAHIASGKDVTVALKAGVCDGKKVRDLAVKLDTTGKVVDMVVDFPAEEGYLDSIDCMVTTKQWLIKTVKNCLARNQYHMDRDLVLGGWAAGTTTVNPYIFEGTVLSNDNIRSYYASSMALKDEKVFEEIFFANHPVYTKVRDRVPVYYDDTNETVDSLIADGCILSGKVTGSVLFRQVTVEAGASVENCVIMNDSVIGAGAELKNVILDKNVTVTPGAKLIGSTEAPIVIARGETV